MSGKVPHIGTLGEKPLHASLKRWYAEPGDRLEVPVDRYVIDLVRDDLLVEIQTRGFSSIKKKISTLLELGHRVRIVHPIPVDTWIVKLETDGSLTTRRRSPRHGVATDVFAELVSFPELLAHDRLEIELLMTVEEEHRKHSQGRAWRRKGWVVVERRLQEVLDSLLILDTADLVALLPEGLPAIFTTSDLADSLSRPLRSAQQMAYCLRKAGVIDAIGKQGNAVQYRLITV